MAVPKVIAASVLIYARRIFVKKNKKLISMNDQYLTITKTTKGYFLLSVPSIA